VRLPASASLRIARGGGISVKRTSSQAHKLDKEEGGVAATRKGVLGGGGRISF
jgi:hypothetical protein